jgi:hypothetical protein
MTRDLENAGKIEDGHEENKPRIGFEPCEDAPTLG